MPSGSQVCADGGQGTGERENENSIFKGPFFVKEEASTEPVSSQ